MNRILKFNQNKNQTVYFTSDLHWNHNPNWPIPLWKSRGYNSVNEMNNDIINVINNVIKSDDILFNLGDLTLNCSVNQFEDFISKINCKNIYNIWGNHNSPSYKIYENEVEKFLIDNNFGCEVYPLRYKNLIFVGNYQEIIVDGMYMVLNHFPIHSWNNMSRGSIHLFGHLHCNNSPTDGKRMDVGWDLNKRPYSANEIFNIMKYKPILSDGGHH